jgi:tripartite-type tricarboxylate transporter receptor subunit TctC
MQGVLHLPGYVFPPAPAMAVDAPNAPGMRAFPQREVHVIVPTSAGGGNDTMARTLTRKLGPLLGQSVVVDNRAGANGTIASEYVAAAQADGHTLLFGYIATHGINPALQKLRYDPVADFSPIGLIGHSPTLLVVPADLPVNSVAELVTLLKHSPTRLSYASAGEGTVPHFAAELFKLHTGSPLHRVDFAGAAPAIAEVAKGRPPIEPLRSTRSEIAVPGLTQWRTRNSSTSSARCEARASRISVIDESMSMSPASGR